MRGTGKKRPRGATFLQLAFVVIIAGAVVFSFGLNVLAPEDSGEIPQRLGMLELASTVEGPEALQRVNQLHGLGIEMKDAFIVEYVHDDQRATVWVGEAESSAAAADLTERMLKAIEDGGSPFGDVRRLPAEGGNEVFQVTGPGGDHFFYHSWRKDRRVVWLTVNAVDVRTVLLATIDNF